MKYDFTTIMDRRGLDATACEEIPIPGAEVDPGFDRIPMWVADMNFATAPSVTEAIAGRLAHPAFGYFSLRDEYFDAIIRWQKERNGVTDIKREYLGYENSVMGGVMSALNVLCSRGDNVLVHAPTYVGFTNALKNAGYHIVLSDLVADSSGVWRMDLRDMEQKIKDHHIHCALLSAPHNPSGRVWTREEILDMMELFRRYDVFVISDEIWSDLILPGHRHIPVHSVSGDARERTVTLMAPSKTFNIAGIVGSYHLIYNDTIRDRVLKESSLSHYNEPNMLSMYALIGGFSETGAEWLDELLIVLDENVDYACRFIKEHFDGVWTARPEGTFMLFLDAGDWCKANKVSIDELLRRGVKCGVIWQDGRAFNGPCHIRMNLALPTSRVVEAFDRLERYVF